MCSPRMRRSSFPRRDPLAIASAIRQTIDHRDESSARAESARHRLATTFAVAPWLAAYERLYREVSGQQV